MKPWVKRHPYVALALLVLLAPVYAIYHMLSHLPEAWEDWTYEWATIWRHARGAEDQAAPEAPAALPWFVRPADWTPGPPCSGPHDWHATGDQDHKICVKCGARE